MSLPTTTARWPSSIGCHPRRWPAEQLERDRYRAMTLIALGRTPEAHAAIERILLADPGYEPGEEEAAPRIRIAFSDVRRRVLPQMARSLYSEGKAAFDRKDTAKAVPAFERTLIVIDLLPAGEPGMADLRTLASGFLQLTRASSTATEPMPTGSAGIGSMPAAVATGGGKTPPPATITARDPARRPQSRRLQLRQRNHLPPRRDPRRHVRPRTPQRPRAARHQRHIPRRGRPHPRLHCRSRRSRASP